MDFETIKYEKQEGYCLITLNRPDALNAINTQMWRELDTALDMIAKDNDIRVFIFTGAPRRDGRPCFSAGADLKEMAKHATGGVVGPARGWTPVSGMWNMRRPRPAQVPTCETITWSPKVSFAAIDGICTAGGIEISLSCDIILASETAEISDMHVKNLGWIGGAAATANMAWRVGVSKALEICLTGDVMDGKEAHRIGLANQVYPPDRLLPEAKKLAAKIGAARLAAVTMTKATCRAVQDMDRYTSWRYCDAGFAALSNEPDAKDWGPGRWVKKRE